jgi:hypothetical protein
VHRDLRGDDVRARRPGIDLQPSATGFVTIRAPFGTEQVKTSCLVTVLLCLIAPPSGL